MNPFSKRNTQAGFTLVEVIVVAVIVAALAGVAVPVYLGYVNSSRLNAATNTAGAVASFQGSCTNSGGGSSLTFGQTVAGPGTVTCDVPPVGVGPEDVSVSIPPSVSVTHDANPNRRVNATHASGGGASQWYSY